MQVSDFRRQSLRQETQRRVPAGGVDAAVDNHAAPSAHYGSWQLPVEHFSPTSLNMLQACPRQFQQRYIQGRKEQPAQARALGNAVHDTLAYNFRCKLHTEHDLDAKVMIEYYDDSSWPRIIERYGGVSEIRWDANPKDVRDLGRAMTVAY